MGILSAVGKEKDIVKESKRTKMIVITLETDGMTLDITLFGEYVDRVKSFFERQPLEHAVIVIQYAKLKTFQGKIILQNVMYGTRILLNPEIEEVVAFRKRVLGVTSQRQPLKLSCNDNSVKHLNEFLDANLTRMISALKDSIEDGSYVVYATVVGVNSSGDWFYLACKCNRAVRADGPMYYCVHCACRVLNVTPRYLIKLSVKDDSGATTFVLFDHEASSILNTSCSDLLEKTDGDGSTENPKEFRDFLMGKSFLFKVEVRSMYKERHEQSFRVSKVCHDAATVTKYLEVVSPQHEKTKSMSEGQVYSADDDFIKITKATTIEALKDCTEDGEYAVYGTIKGVDSDWFIAVCRCGSKVVPRSGSHYCNNCTKRVVNLIPRYRIKARVVDTSDSSTFVIFENVGCLLLHKSCSEMMKYCENVPGGDIQPDAFKRLLIDMSYLFKVEVKRAHFNEFDPSYNVIDVCFNKETVSKFKEINSHFFSTQTDIALALSTGEKSSQHTFSVGEASSCVKNLIEDFVESADHHLEQNVVDIADSTLNKRMKAVERCDGDGDESIKKIKSVKIENN